MLPNLATLRIGADADVSDILALYQNGQRLLLYHPEDANNRALVLAGVTRNGYDLQNAPNFTNDWGVVMAAVQQEGHALLFASQELRADREIVLAAVRNYGQALAYASKELQGDLEVAYAAIENNGEALFSASDELRDDKEFVIAAVTSKDTHYCTLTFASYRLQDDPEVVRRAVEVNGQALEHASERLRNDENIVLAAVNHDGNALQYASRRLKNTVITVQAAVRQNPAALHFASPDLREWFQMYPQAAAPLPTPPEP